MNCEACDSYYPGYPSMCPNCDSELPEDSCVTKLREEVRHLHKVLANQIEIQTKSDQRVFEFIQEAIELKSLLRGWLRLSDNIGSIASNKIVGTTMVTLKLKTKEALK